MNRAFYLAAAAVLVPCALLVASSPAVACGGLFCANAQGPTPPAPVDQGAERIIFEVGADTVTAHVQIQYAGDAEAFAWVVPVPGVPGVAESDPDWFTTLDAATRPVVVLPQPEACAAPASGANECNFGCGGDDASAGNASADVTNQSDTSSPVTVYDHDFTDNYEYHVVGAVDTAALVGWLQENGYNVSDNMTPVMDVYNGGDQKFLALKLRANKDARDIVPIAMTYQSPVPMIPLQLTAVAAQPLMGIQVWIIADTAYAPAFPFHALRPVSEEMVFDAAGTTNYYDWVARAAAESYGRLFVTEFIGWNVQIPGLVDEGDVVSRYYTRLNAEHMDEDPTFVPADQDLAGASVLDFSDRPTLWRCTAANVITERLPSPCAFNYCGLGAECAERGAEIACRCPARQVAMHIAGPTGEDRITCVPKDNPYGVTDEAGGAGTPFDPCNDYACGDAGECVLRGGFPTCSCDLGALASLGGDGRLRCDPPGGPLQTFGPGAGREARGAATPSAPSSRFAFPLAVPLAFFWLFLRRYFTPRIRHNDANIAGTM